jgi:lantibiotic modifying enzyme
MPGDPLFLAMSDRIGARLCHAALWAGPACNWIGPTVLLGAGGPVVVFRASGPDLYGGTSGIALFLGQLYALTGEPIYRETAQAALRQALAYCADQPPARRWGFYSGWPGIAYVAWQLGEWGVEPAGPEAATRLIDRLAATDPATAGADVIDGAAGAIPALISLGRAARRAGWLDLAVQLGDWLCASAIRGAAGWAWVTLPMPVDHPLTGLAHGAAGIAWGLLELWRATGEARFRQAADHALAYERHWFDPQTGNWPDFRRWEPAGPSLAPWPQSLAWCHGAPGGALARLRAYQITRSARLRHEAAAAVAATVRALTPVEGTAGTNYSLCHGQGGNADILLAASDILGDAAYRAVAEGVGYAGIEQVDRANMPWPCGLPDDLETPGLLLGLAGIGQFYLRLYDPARVSSVLRVPL